MEIELGNTDRAEKYRYCIINVVFSRYRFLEFVPALRFRNRAFHGNLITTSSIQAKPSQKEGIENRNQMSMDPISFAYAMNGRDSNGGCDFIM